MKIRADGIWHFIAAAIATLILPLLPLGIEYGFYGYVSYNSIRIASVMYCAAIFLSSDNPALIVGGIVATVSLAVGYGFELAAENSRLGAASFALEELIKNAENAGISIQPSVTDLISQRDANTTFPWFPFICICAAFLSQLIKCYDQHIVKRQNFILIPKLESPDSGKNKPADAAKGAGS